ncbi:MAG: phage Gp37/Gp68 family protein [Planctomycetota bacterium]|nr:phage Gp37/Gp68 family protein [Planctomycetota bacterium]
MAQGSSIEWTEATWNPVTGCDKVSPGCKHCYAERMSNRLRAMNNPRYTNGFDLTLHDDLLTLPLRWKKPRRIFVNSMSDLFHVDVPEPFLVGCFDTMRQAHWHTFQVLTKRPERAAELVHHLPWPSNVWMGTSIENADYYWRIDELRTIPAAIRFLSVEPLLGPVDDIPLDGIHWVIAGGESGPRCHPMQEAWAIALRDRCREAGVAFFFKQWGGVNKKRTGRLLEGRTWDEMPAVEVSE